jgi:hypothetical protein
MSLGDEEYEQLLADDEFIRNYFGDDAKKYLQYENRHLIEDPKLYRLRHRDIKEDYPEIVATILDITMHHLALIDAHMGMNKWEYYINFIINDMKQGRYGSRIQDSTALFAREELVVIADCLLSLYASGEEVYVLKESVRRIFEGSLVFSNTEARHEIVLFLRTKETEAKAEKIAILQYLFLPFRYTCEIYWERMFGIIDTPELMQMGEMVNY